MQQHVLAAAVAELDHVALQKLDVGACLDALLVDVGAVGGVQVDYVGLHRATCREKKINQKQKYIFFTIKGRASTELLSSPINKVINNFDHAICGEKKINQQV